MTQLEKPAEPTHSLGATWRLVVARAMRRGMEAGASMRGRKSRWATPRRRELIE
jgi:hypothetical protein